VKYYRATNDMALTGTWLLSDFLSDDGRKVLRWDCGYGKRIPNPGHLSVRILKVGNELDLNFNTWNTMIVSRKAKSVLDQWVASAIQYFPVTVRGASQPYFIANVIQLVDCLDETLSVVERFQPNDPVRPDRAGEISSVIDLHVDASRIPDNHLFRISSYHRAVIISEDLKKSLDSAGASGFRYADATSPNIAEYRIGLAEVRRRLANASDEEPRPK
jgi:hypothetical protein